MADTEPGSERPPSPAREGPTTAHTAAFRRPLQSINRRWQTLSLAVNDRQAQLEKALLQMGQFTQALDQLQSWIVATDGALDELRPVPGDLQGTEILLARLKVLQNDIDSHQASIHTLNDAGKRLINAQPDKETTEATQVRLDKLNTAWSVLQDHLVAKQGELEQARSESEGFAGHIHTWLDWLSRIESALSASKPVGGLPETAKDQLDAFMVTYDEMETSRPLIEEIITKGTQFTEQSEANRASALAHSVVQLRQRWNNACNRAADKKTKLEIALRDATEFNTLHKECAEWIANTEKELHGLQPVSRLKEPLTKQMDTHKDLQSRLEAQRAKMLELDKKGTHLKYFSQKQDVILVKNLLVSASHRWDRLSARIAERARQLDNAHAESSLFYDAYDGLMAYVKESTSWLDQQQSVPASNPDKIKESLNELKTFQQQLHQRQPAFDSAMKVGKELKNHAPKNEQHAIEDMIKTLKDAWNSMASSGVDRHRRLEEALLFSGEFNEAVAELQAWLDNAADILKADPNLHGDLESVQLLQERHRAILSELKSRSANIDTVRRAANELTSTGDAESTAHINDQMGKLNDSWDEVNRLAADKSSRLEVALADAENFHQQSRSLLETLAGIEQRLKQPGPLPDAPELLHHHSELIDQIKYELAEQKHPKQECVALGEEILGKAHPDAIHSMQHWVSLIKSRWEEVSAWCTQRDNKLNEHIRSLKDRDQLLDELMTWLGEKEEKLDRADREPIPEDPDALEQLIVEHSQFQDGLRTRQPEIDEVTKIKRRQEAEPPVPPAKTGRKTPTQKKPQPKVDPKVKHVSEKWRHIWLVCAERQRKLQDMKNLLEEMEKVKNFNFDDWRRRYMAWMNHKKARVMDFFRRQDTDNDGRVTRQEFIEGILQSKFPTNRLEMNAVADIFDKDKDGYIDYKEFIAALRPDREPTEPRTDSQRIKDELTKQIQMCTCHNRYKVKEVGEGRYTFGEMQKLRLVRILRSTVMVRVGGGWTALDEFLVKNDPCRAKGRTNLELREKFILPEGVSQTMQAFRTKPGRPGSSSGASSTFSTPQGPVIKIREKTERSMPMRTTRSGSAQSPADSEVSSILSDRRSSDVNTPGVIRPGSRTGSGRGRLLGAYGSRPGSRGSRPPSRAGSDVSEAGSIASRDSLAASTPTRIPSARKKWRN